MECAIAVSLGRESVEHCSSRFLFCSRFRSWLFAIWNGHRTPIRPNLSARPSHRRLIPIIPANFQLRFRPSMLEPVAIGRLQLLQEPPFTLCGTRQQRSRASLRDLIFECRAFGVIFLEPCFRSVCICKDLQMVGIADLLARVDIDDVCHCWSLLSLRRPQCVSLREESNSRTTFRFNALMMPMRANIVGPSCSATSNSACIAACHWGYRVLPLAVQ